MSNQSSPLRPMMSDILSPTQSSPLPSPRITELKRHIRKSHNQSSSSDGSRKRTLSAGRKASLSFVHHDSASSYIQHEQNDDILEECRKNGILLR